MRHGFAGVLVLGAFLWSASAQPAAHHAVQAAFDQNDHATLTGVLTKVLWINPHVRWFFDVKNPDGSTTKWEVTGAGPGVLRQNGMTRIFKVGEVLDVVYAPARDGAPLGRVVTFTFPDGRVVTLFHEDPANPFNQ